MSGEKIATVPAADLVAGGALEVGMRVRVLQKAPGTNDLGTPEAAIVTWVSENTAKIGFLIFTSARDVEDHGMATTRSLIVDLDDEDAPAIDVLD